MPVTGEIEALPSITDETCAPQPAPQFDILLDRFCAMKAQVLSLRFRVCQRA
jgi:hypothetical protein